MADISKDATDLRNFIDSHTQNERAVVVDQIMGACFVPRSTVYNWKFGNCRIPELYKRKIEEIFGSKIFKSLV